MLNENTELLDAIEFKRRLIYKVNKGKLSKPSNADTGEQKKEEEEENKKIKAEKREQEEGKRIGLYLDEIVPDWRSMRATLLYKQIQYMLGTAEKNICFEIETFAKRITYIVPLVIILFTTFSYLFYNIYGTESSNISNIKIVAVGDVFGNNSDKLSNKSETDFLAILVIIASANSILLFYLAFMNMLSQRWQQNWEYHIDYLQAILGLNLMRVCREEEESRFRVREIGILFGLLSSTIWSMVTIFVSSRLIVAIFKSECGVLAFSSCKPSELGLLGVTISAIVISLMLSFLYTFYSLSVIQFIFRKSKPANIVKEMNIRGLQELSYSREKDTY